MDMAEKIQERLKAVGMSQRSLEIALGLAENRVSKWVRSPWTLRLVDAHRIAKTLGVSVDYLADDSIGSPNASSDLSDQERTILEMARTVGYELAKARLMGVVKPEMVGSEAKEAEASTPGVPPGRLLGRRSMPRPKGPVKKK